MADNNRSNETNGAVGLVLGAVCLVAAAVFMLSGGELGGEKKIRGDADMPPVASPVPPKE